MPRVVSTDNVTYTLPSGRVTRSKVKYVKNWASILRPLKQAIGGRVMEFDADNIVIRKRDKNVVIPTWAGINLANYLLNATNALSDLEDYCSTHLTETYLGKNDSVDKLFLLEILEKVCYTFKNTKLRQLIQKAYLRLRRAGYRSSEKKVVDDLSMNELDMAIEKMASKEKLKRMRDRTNTMVIMDDQENCFSELPEEVFNSPNLSTYV